MTFLNDFKQSIIVLQICTVIALFVGYILSEMASILESLPGLLIIIPGVLDMRGNIHSAMGARLGTSMHLGLVPKKFTITDEFTVNMGATLFLTIINSIFLCTLATVSLYLLNGHISIIKVFLKLLLIIIVASTISCIILSFFGFFITIFSAKTGIDPDNISTPSLATVGDLITILFVFIVARIMVGV